MEFRRGDRRCPPLVERVVQRPFATVQIAGNWIFVLDAPADATRRWPVRILERFRPLSQRWLSVFVFESVFPTISIDGSPRSKISASGPDFRRRTLLDIWLADTAGGILRRYPNTIGNDFHFSNWWPSEPKVSTFSMSEGECSRRSGGRQAPRNALDERWFCNNRYSALSNYSFRPCRGDPFSSV